MILMKIDFLWSDECVFQQDFYINPNFYAKNGTQVFKGKYLVKERLLFFKLEHIQCDYDFISQRIVSMLSLNLQSTYYKLKVNN